MKPQVIGWDIGGAHLKAVMLDAQGKVIRVSQQSCALWKGLPLLEAAMQQVLQDWQVWPQTYDHAVTMTGELVDLFTDRAQGVNAIAGTVLRMLPQAQFYCAGPQQPGGFIANVAEQAPLVASMNWHASALCLATDAGEGAVLVLDIGSTTSDITLCDGPRVLAIGWTDAERMACQGLFYTGVVRTPLMALGPLINWADSSALPVQRHIAAEYFATTADVYRLLGELPPQHDLADTADGQGRTEIDTMRRLARMVGHDVEDRAAAVWHSLAQAFKATQLQALQLAIQSQMSRAERQPVKIIGLGAGSFLAETLAQTLGLDYQAASAGILADDQTLRKNAEVCFPAYAVARLWQAWH